ncbi:MAG: hypothetical protein IPN97_12325 [Saprospiraceae bacterium]|nr:hypothetical protein [Saprospiraceae bacterium]
MLHELAKTIPKTLLCTAVLFTNLKEKIVLPEIVELAEIVWGAETIPIIPALRLTFTFDEEPVKFLTMLFVMVGADWVPKNWIPLTAQEVLDDVPACVKFAIVLLEIVTADALTPVVIDIPRSK